MEVDMKNFLAFLHICEHLFLSTLKASQRSGQGSNLYLTLALSRLTMHCRIPSLSHGAALRLIFIRLMFVVQRDKFVSEMRNLFVDSF